MSSGAEMELTQAEVPKGALPTASCMAPAVTFAERFVSGTCAFTSPSSITTTFASPSLMTDLPTTAQPVPCNTVTTESGRVLRRSNAVWKSPLDK